MAKKKCKIPALRRKLWKLMSIYIRSTSAIDGSTTQGKCYTCDKYISLKYKTDCGHFYPKKSFDYLYYDTRNIRIQCKKCNGFLQGNVVEYERRLRKEIGAEHMEELHNTRNIKPDFKREWLVEEVATYQSLVDALPFVLGDNTE